MIEIQRLKPIFKFIGIALGLYLFLIIPWPGLSEGYADAFRAVGQKIYGSMWSQGIVDFRPLETDDIEDQDTVIFLMRQQAPGDTGPFHRGRAFTSSRYNAYVPIVLVMALVLATPLPRKSRLKALLLGLVLIHFYIGFKLWIQIYDSFTPTEVTILTIPTFFKTILHAVSFLLTYVENSFIAPVFVWLIAVLSFTSRREWNKALRHISPVKSG